MPAAEPDVSDRELKLLCRAVGDLSRLHIIRELTSHGELTVTDLAGALVLSQPLASWHVRILKRAGLVTTHKEGRQVYCSLDRRRVAQFQAALGGLVQPHSESGKEDAWETSVLPSSA